jgi:hypothetical protein
VPPIECADSNSERKIIGALPGLEHEFFDSNVPEAQEAGRDQRPRTEHGLSDGLGRAINPEHMAAADAFSDRTGSNARATTDLKDAKPSP